MTFGGVKGMKRKLVLIFALMLYFWMPVNAATVQPSLKIQTPDGINFEGYFRAGSGGNFLGGKMEAFQAPDAPVKYRLGNEQETYLESIFSKENLWDLNGPKVRAQVRVAYKTQQNQSEDTYVSGIAAPSSVAAIRFDKVCLREVFASMSNFIDGMPEAKVWAGERFYRLPQLEINDFWWSDMSGYGGGLEDLAWGNGKLNIAYIGYASNDLAQQTSSGRFYKSNLHMMLKDVVSASGRTTFWINGGYMGGGTSGEATYPSLAGVDTGLMHVSTNARGDSNQLGLQFGYGINDSLSSAANIPPAAGDGQAWKLRLTNMTNWQFNPRFGCQMVEVLQFSGSTGRSNSNMTWASFGMRPVIGLKEHIAMEIEPGFDYVYEPAKNYNDCLLKLTASLRVGPDESFSAHPRFRVFGTLATWGADFRNKNIGGVGFNNRSYGANFGVQCEHWW